MTEESARSPRGFEPPPWEVERFEQLAARRAADEEARRLADEAAVALRGQTAMRDEAAAEAADRAAEEAVTAEAKAGPATGVRGLDEASTEAMLLGLREEEPTALAGAWVVTMIAGICVMLMGLAMGATGVMSLASTRGGTTQQVLGLGAMFVGALVLLGFGGWMVAKSLKTRSIGG